MTNFSRQETFPPLTPYSWISLVVFFITVGVVIRPIYIPLPKSSWKVPLTTATMPVISSLFLWAIQAIVWETVKNGIVGVPGMHVEPYSIVLLVLGLATIAEVLNQSGLFAKTASVLIKRAIGDGSKDVQSKQFRRLFYSFYFLAGVIALFFSNDVVILVLTPIILYALEVLPISAFPFLISTFQVSNTASLGLYVGNPTNILVAEFNQLSFLTYSAWMLIPTLFTVGSTLLLLSLALKMTSAEPTRIGQPLDAEIKSVSTAIIAGLCMLGSLITLMVVTLVLPGTSVWICVIPFAVFVFFWQLGMDIFKKDKTEIIELENLSSPTIESEQEKPGKVKLFFQKVTERFPLSIILLSKIPWSVAPFCLGMFVLVEALAYLGWTVRVAWCLGWILTSYWSAVLSMALVSTILCNLGNNLPMTIFLVRCLSESVAFEHVVPPNDSMALTGTKQGAMFGLVIGANFAANLLPIASLAGIMWKVILQRHDEKVPTQKFFIYGLLTVPVALLLASGIVILEMWVWNQINQ